MENSTTYLVQLAYIDYHFYDFIYFAGPPSQTVKRDSHLIKPINGLENGTSNGVSNGGLHVATDEESLKN